MTQRCQTCGGSMPWKDGDGEPTCLLCGRTGVAPQRAEDFEVDQARIRSRVATSALTIRFIRQAKRPVAIAEIAQAIGASRADVVEALDAAVGRELVTSESDPADENGERLFQLAM